MLLFLNDFQLWHRSGIKFVDTLLKRANNMKKIKGDVQGKKVAARFMTALVLGLGLVSTASSAVTVTGNIGYVSDYTFRGISQTNEGMAIQGGLTLNDDSGFYLSSWGSNINFGQGSMELDILAGWTGKITEELSTDVGVMQYRYPNGDNATDQFNFVELYGKLIYKDFVFGLAYSSDYFGTDVDGYYYLSADYTYPIMDKLSLLAHLSYNKFEDNAQYTTFLAAGPVGGSGYMDWSLGLGTTLLDTAVQLKYVGTDIDDSAECAICDNRAVFSVTKSL